MIKITCANIKGGVGKTNTVFQVSAILSSMGYKVLCIDNDAQGNLTRSFLPEKVKPDLFDLLMKKSEFNEVVRQPFPDNEVLKNIYLLPTTYDLYFFKEGLDEKYCTPFRLENIISSANIDFDVVLIDTNPAISLTNDNAYVFSDYIIGVADATIDSLDGLSYLESVIDDINDVTSKKIEFLGILINRVKSANFNKEIIQIFKNKYQDLLFDTMITDLIGNAESRGFSTPLIEYDSSGKSTEQFKQLTTEILNRVGKGISA